MAYPQQSVETRWRRMKRSCISLLNRHEWTKPYVQVASSVVIGSVFEELLWRGVCISPFLLSSFWVMMLVIVSSSLSYGCLHYYFGKRHVVLKMGYGIVWSALFIVSGQLMSVIISHVLFDLLIVLESMQVPKNASTVLSTGSRQS